MTLSHPKLRFCAVLFLFLITSAAFSQTNTIVLEHKGKDRQVTISENKRIKVTTTDGQKFVGRFSVIDDNSIQIKGITIPLDSIATLQKRSVFYSIIRPIIIINGVAVAIIGIAGVSTYGPVFTATMVSGGLPLTFIDSFFNKHKSEKWNYRIEKIE